MTVLPRIVWIYWQQGEDNAPEIVKRCIASWRLRNPGWSVRVLDEGSVQDPTGLSHEWFTSRPDISIQFMSDMIRVALLSRHGGVWADASVYCSRPLDGWLPPRMQSGFFAFEGINRGRMIGSPFMAAQQDNIIPNSLLRNLVEMFQNRRFTCNETRYGLMLRAILKPPLEITPNTTRLWFSRFFTDVLKLYPYFTLHYMFNKLVLEDSEFADAWSRTPTLPSSLFAKIKHGNNLPAVTEDIRQFIKTENFPVHKLNWHTDLNTPYWTEVFQLLEKSGIPAVEE